MSCFLTLMRRCAAVLSLWALYGCAVAVEGARPDTRLTTCITADTPTVAFCDVVAQPSRFDGRRIALSAVWMPVVVSPAIGDPACLDTDGQLRLCSPRRSGDETEAQTALWTRLYESERADVTLVGVFRSNRPGTLYGSAGQVFAFDVDCIERIDGAVPRQPGYFE